MRKRVLRVALSMGGLALGAYLLYSIFSSSDVPESLSLLGSLPLYAIVLLLLPSIFGASFDSLAWRFLLPEQVNEHSHLRSFWRIFRVRLASESVVNTVPMGAVVADPLKAVLLKRFFGLSLACASASVALRTFLLGDAQALIVLIVTLFSFGWIASVSLTFIHNPFLSWILLGLSLGGLAIYTILIVTSSSGNLSQKLHGLLRRIRIRKLRDWLVEQDAHFLELHRELASFGQERQSMIWYSFGSYLLTWSMEGVETYLIFRFIGLPLSFEQAFTLEAICSFIRSVAFVIPSGLGAQDAGYAAFLTQAGESQAIAVAFILAKRIRQILWILPGLLLVFIQKRTPAQIADQSDADDKSSASTSSDDRSSAQELK